MSNSQDGAPGYDLSELLILVHAEMRTVIDAIEAEPLATCGLLVDTIRVKMGQKVAKAPGDEAGAGEEEPAVVLNEDRYPPAEDGWLIELDYRPGQHQVQARVADESVAVLPIPRLRTAAPLFAPLPVRAMKGIHHTWAKRLATFGIETVGQLAELDDDRLAKIVAKTRSRLPLEFRVKARLVGGGVPALPPSDADRLSLYALAIRTPPELRKLIGVRLSAIDSRSLASLIAVLVTTIDTWALQKLTLGELRESAEA